MRAISFVFRRGRDMKISTTICCRGKDGEGLFLVERRGEVCAVTYLVSVREVVGL